MGQLYKAMRDVPWEASRWPNFTPAEIACPCCGEVYLDEEALDCLQKLRSSLGVPLKIMSGHRCVAHNRTVGGAAHSQHLQLAFDVALGNLDRATFYAKAREAGFHGFGFMRTGMHLDTRAKSAAWNYGPESVKAWEGVIPPGTGAFHAG